MISEQFNLSAKNPIISNHKVYGQQLMPGLAYIDLVFQVFKKHGHSFNRLELRNLSIYKPLIVEHGHSVRLGIYCNKASEKSWEVRMEGQSQRNGSLDPKKTLYATAEMHQRGYVQYEETLDMNAVKLGATSVSGLNEIYEMYQGQELVHTGFMKAEGQVYELDSAAIMDISLSQEAQISAGEFMFHPALIDGSGVGSGRLFAPPVKKEERLFLPLFYESFSAAELLQKRCITRVQRASVLHKNELMYWTMEFFNEHGRKVGELRNFAGKLVREAGLINPERSPMKRSFREIQAVNKLPVYSDKPAYAAYEMESNGSKPAASSIESFLRQLMADTLNISIDEIDPGAGYYEMGLDSPGLLGIVKAIESKLNTSLTPTLLFEYTTITELSAYLEEKYDMKSSLEDPAEQAPGSNTTSIRISGSTTIYSDLHPGTSPVADEDIAIIGMSGRYPQARNLQEFWMNLREGKDCIREIPENRWDWKSMKGIKSPSGKDMSKWGGFIDDPDCFDPKFFRISPREAETMDPQERLFLETCWEAIEDAGYTLKTLVTPRNKNNRRKVGVFAGVMHKDYSLVGAEAVSKGQAIPLSLNVGPIANRVSYFCNFHGPSMAVDTLCSSSLTAVHLAMESIKRGESEIALAGGVNLSLHPAKYMTYGMWGMHSSDGYCNTFGRDGDGYVSAEGVAVVLLKPLTKAIEDGDRIYSVLKGSAINHVGTVSGIMVPGPVAQGDVITDCLEQARINPRTISYVEAHGTGTSLGDPIEIEGLMKAFENYTDERQFCSIGSVKSNIGHAESAAGVIGLQKAALQIYHKTLVPSLHSEELNPYIDFQKSPFYVQHKTEEWKQTVIEEGGLKVKYPRRAGLSSFGATGSNAHIIMEEHIETKVREGIRANASGRRNVIVPLSARNTERLKIYAAQLLEYLENLSASMKKPEKIDEEPSLVNVLQLKIRELLAGIIHVSEDLIEMGVAWSDYGVEPVQIRQLKEKIRDELHIEIDDTELVQRSSVTSVANYLWDYHRDAVGADGEVAAYVEVACKEEQILVENNDVSLEDVAYTLQVGRESMEERVVFAVRDLPELIQGLLAFLDNPNEAKDFYRGQVKPFKDAAPNYSPDIDTRELMMRLNHEGNMELMAEWWAKGLEVDWNLLYGDSKPSRISLPTYPFARERYWIPAADEAFVTRAAGAAIHPLLHKNTSDFTEQRFNSIFTGNEFFLSDHVVKGQKVLPGVAYLEMARAAITKSLGTFAQEDRIRIKNVVWIRPVAVEGEIADVGIRLLPEANSGIAYEIFSNNEDADIEQIVHSKGSAELVQAEAKPSLDIEALKKQCGEQFLTSSQFYDAFKEMGIDYGPGHRGIEEAYTGAGQVLAKLALPSRMSGTLEQYVLHPSLMDSALQATIGLQMGSGDRIQGSLRPVMPFALQEIEVFASCTANMWAWVRYSDQYAAGDKTLKMDIDLCDEAGYVCVRMRGFSTRVLEGEVQIHNHSSTVRQETKSQPPVGNIQLFPVWDAVTVEKGNRFPSVSERVMVVGGNENRIAVQSLYPQAHFFEIDREDTIESIAGKLEAYSIDHIVWIAPECSWNPLVESLLKEQERGVILFFKMIKALISLNYHTKDMGWTVITFNTQPVLGNDTVNPAHAGVLGLVGSMAKEYPNWNIRIIDLEAGSDWPSNDIFALPADHRGHPWAYRKQEWYRQQLIPVNSPSQDEKTMFKSGGVYVVIGGTGGIGKAWSEYMVRTYKARIVWIGRRQKDASIDAEMKRIGFFGPEPTYISADAADLSALSEAYKEIKKKYSEINGIIHSAMALSDTSLADMEEKQFRAGLSAKVDVSVRMAQVFSGEHLDFVMFFSSLISFIKNPRQSHYAAGCTFKDAFAHRLTAEWPCSVKVMNWGYWNSAEADSSEDVKQLARIGLGLIEPEDGMKAVEILVSKPVHQLAMIKTSKPLVVEGMNPKQYIDIRSDSHSLSLQNIRSRIPGKSSQVQILNKGMGRNQEMLDLISRILLSELGSLELFKAGNKTFDDFKTRSGISDKYQRWIEESIRVLEENHLLYLDGETYQVTDTISVDRAALWKEWEQKKAIWIEDLNLKAWMNLTGAMLEQLPGILTGRRLATDIMFPNSSMEMVEGIYKNNPVADHFNEVLADTLIAFIGEKLQEDPSAKIRIIEIGAGTGGTSSMLFHKLSPYQAHIEEYCYTDISKAFLLFAEQEYGPNHPYLTYKLFNVDAPSAGSSTPSGEFDIAVATNVLHATRNIRQTLRNTKAVLKKNGMVLINELSDNRLFTHLTFGLLEGWWLYEDVALRIPGCPGLYPAAWQAALESEGYKGVFFPAKDAHGLGQQIIAASSNGVVRQMKPLHSGMSDTPDRSVAKDRMPGMSSRLPLSLSFAANNKPLGMKESGTGQTGTGVTAQMMEDHVRETIIEKLSEALKVNRNEIDVDESFADYGLDSIIGVHLVQVLNQALQIELDTTSLFDYSSVKQLSAYILSDHEDGVASVLGKNNGNVTSDDDHVEPIFESMEETNSYSYFGRFMNKAALPVPQIDKGTDSLHHSMHKEPIAIIGMSGKFAESPTVSDLWKHLSSGTELIGKSPRWDLSDYYPKDAKYCDSGGFVDDIDKFDPFFFNINGLEASYMDPQQRKFLEECWKALEDSGYTGSRIQGSKCGVYVGCLGGAGDYHQLSGDDTPPQAFWGIAGSVVPARIAYYLDLKGPAIAIDTACSSSLVAVHIACQGLWAGETDMALAGGVFIQSTPWYYLSTNKAGMLSQTGHSYTFDERADGFVPGEGAGVLVLKRLGDAVEDGDHIYGVIQGSGMNQDGTTNGITAPSANSQERLECSVYDTFDIDPSQIQVIEAHGTGTKLGDPIEYQALTRAFRQYTDNKEYCAIGSVKTNIGHAAHAAGVAGIIKILLSLQHKQIPPTLNFETGNSNIQFKDSPFYVNTNLRTWETGSNDKRLAAVSSFGFSGTNAHIVIEEAPEVAWSHTDKPGYLIVLSARTKEQLQRQAAQMADYCEQNTQADVGNISYTLLVGRKHFNCRLACVVRNLDELISFLRKWLAGSKVPQIYISELNENERREQPSLKRYGNYCIRECQKVNQMSEYVELLSAVAELHVQGYPLDMEELFSSERFSIVSLPTYPFAVERYWVPDKQVNRAGFIGKAAAEKAELHPLLHLNTSDLTGVRFSSTFTGNESYIVSHAGRGMYLPGMSYLEMARQAVSLSAGAIIEGHDAMRLLDVVWASPVEIGQEALKVNLEVFPDDNGEIVYEIYSKQDKNGGDPVIHSQGKASTFTTEKTPVHDLTSLKLQSDVKYFSREQWYLAPKASEREYHPQIQVIEELWVGQNQVLAKLSLPATIQDSSEPFILHPSLTDSALQASIGLRLAKDADLHNHMEIFGSVLPVSLQELQIIGKPTRETWILVKYSDHDQSDHRDKFQKLDIDLCDHQGSVYARMKGLTVRVPEGKEFYSLTYAKDGRG